MIKFSKRDVLYIGSLFIIGIILTVYIFCFSENGNTLIISIDGSLYGEYSLDTDNRVNISNDYGENTIIIDNGYVYMLHANCPDGLCINQGKINKVGQNIVCLPHRLVLEISGDEKGEFDAVAS